MIDVEGVTYRYAGADEAALDNVSLTVGTGELFGLLGPNGAGKSTLLSLATGLRKMMSGSIALAGMDIGKRPRDIQRIMAWVPQEYAFYPALSVKENLSFFAGAQEIGKSLQRDRIAEVADITGLQSVLNKRAEHFSGGLKRRLNVAISLLGRPQYLFLDEPTVGIDPQSRHFILEAIRNINEQGTTVVYSSHYMEEVESLCKHIVIIDNGRVLKSGSLQELLGQGSASSVDVVLETQLPASVQIPESMEMSADRLNIHSDSMQQHELGQLLVRLSESNVQVNRLVSGTRNLEQLFLQLTKRSLRD